ncbi:MAG: peptidylprolyl isomerase [Anaerolineales bacterium]|nr:peptidylprolyl isomerase [Anaerolineales bacterium]
MPKPRNKKFIAIKEKEKRQKRIIIIGTAVVLAAVLGLVLYGVFDLRVLQPKKTIVELGSRTVNVTEFKQRVRYQRFQLSRQAMQLVQIQQSMGGDAQTSAYFQQQLMQIAQQLNQPNTIGQQVIQTLTDELIIMEEADKMGIEISEETFERELKGLFGYFPQGTPTPQATFAPQPTSTLTSQQLTLVPDTPTATTEAQETEGEEESTAPTPTATLDQESEGENDPTATPMIQPTEITAEVYQENYQEWIDSLNDEAGIKEETFRELVRGFLIQQEVREKVTTDLKRTQDQVWARHILVEDEETAQEVLSKLEEGETFADLASEYSVDTSNKDRGGNLGWFGRGTMVPAFEEIAFALDTGEVSDPIQTQFGWHIIQVIGHEERSISQERFQQLKDQAFRDWLAEKRQEYEAEVADDWQKYVPSEPDLPPQLQQIINLSQQQPQQNPPPATTSP